MIVSTPPLFKCKPIGVCKERSAVNKSRINVNIAILFKKIIDLVGGIIIQLCPMEEKKCDDQILSIFELDDSHDTRHWERTLMKNLRKSNRYIWKGSCIA